MNILRVELNINRNVITSFIIKICVTESAIPKRDLDLEMFIILKKQTYMKNN